MEDFKSYVGNVFFQHENKIETKVWLDEVEDARRIGWGWGFSDKVPALPILALGPLFKDFWVRGRFGRPRTAGLVIARPRQHLAGPCHRSKNVRNMYVSLQ